MPAKTQLIDLTDKMKEAVVGDYLVKPGDTLHVFSEDTQLYLQETGQSKNDA